MTFFKKAIGISAISVSVLAAQSQTTSSSGEGSSLYTLGLAGIDSTSAGASGPSRQYFVEFDTLAPLGWCNQNTPADRGHSLQHRCWFWFNPRLASAPAASAGPLLLSSSSLASGISSQAITQTADIQAGFEWSPTAPWDGAQAAIADSSSRTALSLIAGGGIVTPLASASAAEYSLSSNLAAQFQANPALASAYPQLASALCNYGYGTSCPASRVSAVAFVFANRSRLYRDYYAGLRLRSFYFTSDCKTASECKIQNTFPGTFDVRFGQDETVTAGRLSGLVMTLTGSYPLPGSQGTVRVFGAVYTRFAGNRSVQALALQPLTSTIAITDPSVVVQQIAPADQDYFRIGLGIDLVPLISKWAGK